MQLELRKIMFPEELLEHFEVKAITILCMIDTKQEIYQINLEEKNCLPEGNNKRE